MRHTFASILTLTFAFILGNSAMAAGKAKLVCIGLTHLDPKNYAGDPGTLTGCDHDAQDMQAIGSMNLGDPGTLLVNEQATRQSVLNAIDSAASSLGAGDLFMISFSGHGGEIPDSEADAANGMDQTWCLYDGQLLDKELYARFSHFKGGVRVLVFSDSCHSAGITKFLLEDYELATIHATQGRQSNSISLAVASARVEEKTASSRLPKGFQIKQLPTAVLVRSYEGNKDAYDKIVKNIERPVSPIAAWVLSISACGDDETSGDAGVGRNSVFTAALLKVWDNGKYRSDGNYQTFQDDIGVVAVAMRPEQHAASRMIDDDHMSYWRQRPFRLQSP